MHNTICITHIFTPFPFIDEDTKIWRHKLHSQWLSIDGLTQEPDWCAQIMYHLTKGSCFTELPQGSILQGQAQGSQSRIKSTESQWLGGVQRMSHQVGSLGVRGALCFQICLPHIEKIFFIIKNFPLYLISLILFLFFCNLYFVISMLYHTLSHFLPLIATMQWQSLLIQTPTIWVIWQSHRIAFSYQTRN